MKNRIWLVSEYYYPIKTGTGYYITEIAEYLAQTGMDVQVVCAGIKYNETSNNYIFAKREIRNGVTIHRVGTVGLSKNKFFLRTIRMMDSSIRMYFKLLKNVAKHERILVVTDPPFLVVLMPFIQRLKKLHYTLLVYDVFPENLVAIGKMQSTSIAYRIFKKSCDWAYAKANEMISIGRDMSELLYRKAGRKDNIHLITNWSDNDIVHRLTKKDTTFYRQLNCSFPLLFQFAGNFGHAQGIDNLLSAITMVNNEAIGFLFIGSGAKAEVIRQFANDHPNVLSVGFQDRSNQKDFLNACDVAIITLSDGMFGLGVPSKSYNIMAAGKPILYIGDAQSEIALCIKEHHIGWIVEPNNPKALCETIEDIFTHQNDLEEKGRKARLLAETVFAKQIILHKYYTLLQKE